MGKFIYLLVFLSFLGMQTFAQKTVTGTVTSAKDGSVLPGVTVVVQGTSKGTITDNQGKYSLDVPEGGETLVFSFIGMNRVEMPIGDQTVINVKMASAVTELDELVVTALGVSREKKSLGYAVQEVSGEEIDKVKKRNVINSISGKVAGVQIRNNTNLGGSSNIIIRGSTSLLGDNQALFVVDGVPVNNSNTNTSYQKVGGSGYDYGNPISDIDPSNIENVSVLKGAAATALYGSRAANGVIVITTKKGKKAREGEKNFQINLGHTMQFSVIDKSTFPTYQDKYGAGYGPYYSDSDIPFLEYYDMDGDGVDDYVVPVGEDGSIGAEFDPNLMVFGWESMFPESPMYLQKKPFVAAENMADQFFETGATYTTNIDVNGGTDKSTFRIAYTNTDQTGILPNSSLKKHNFNFSSSYDVLDDVTISASATYTNTATIGRNHTGYSDNIMSMFRQWWNVGVDLQLQEDLYHNTGQNITWNPVSDQNLLPHYWDNPYWQRFENYQSDDRDRFVGYVKGDWQITDELSFMTQYSVDQYTFIQEERKAVGSVAGAFGVTYPDVRSGYARTSIEFMETNFDAMLKYKKDLTSDINLNAFVGTNIRRTTYSSVRASTNAGLAVPNVYALSNSASPMLPPEERYEPIGVNGFFGSASLGFYNMFFLDLTARNDISSTLPEEKRSFFYPSVTSSFLFSELIELDWLDLGKVRVNWAQVGNDAQWGRVNDAYRIVSPFGSRTLTRFATFKANPDLKPEISTSIEGGLELAMFGNRLGVDLAFYKTNTVDQIVDLPVSTATGYSAKVVNIGDIENRGVELQLRGTPVKTKDFRWDVILNWSKNINEVISLGDDIDNLQIASLQGGVTINAREGEPYGAIMGTDFVYHDGQRVVDEGGFYMETSTNDQVIGNIQPDWNAGLGNNFSYKNFSFSFLIDMQMGGQIFSLDQWYGQGTGLYDNTVGTNYLGNPERDPIVQNDDGTYAANSGGILIDGVVGVDNDGDGTPDEYVQNTTMVPGNFYFGRGWATSPNARYIYDATYVKLRELTFGYTLPSKLLDKVFIERATVSFIASNLWILYKDLPYADPEASQGAGNVQGWQSGVMPATRNFGFSVNLTF